jgi:hypothetical protein
MHAPDLKSHKHLPCCCACGRVDTGGSPAGSFGPARPGLGQQRRALEFVAHDRDRGLAVDDPLGHPWQCEQVNTAVTGVSVTR